MGTLARAHLTQSIFNPPPNYYKLLQILWGNNFIYENDCTHSSSSFDTIKFTIFYNNEEYEENFAKEKVIKFLYFLKNENIRSIEKAYKYFMRNDHRLRQCLCVVDWHGIDPYIVEENLFFNFNNLDQVVDENFSNWIDKITFNPSEKFKTTTNILILSRGSPNSSLFSLPIDIFKIIYYFMFDILAESTINNERYSLKSSNDEFSENSNDFF